jgi:ribonuclease BN (tRNA processing enzyme)
MAMGESGGALYIAGSSYAVPRPGRANAGYLLRAGGSSIVIDFGTGAFANMREKLDPVHLDAIVVSHMHADHFFDLVPLRYALRYELQRGKALPVYLPPGGIAVMNQIANPLKETDDFYDGVFDLKEYAVNGPVQIGECTVQFKAAVHYIPSYAMRFETRRGVLAYSADTAPCDAVVALARDADIFLCEASLGSNGTENGMRGHLNAREAGEMAASARANHLVLTHYGIKTNPAAMRSAAAEAFKGRISVADDRMEFVF